LVRKDRFQLSHHEAMKNPKKFPSSFRKLLQSVTNKRARVVIDHILRHGFITTEELEKRYGYNHPPRAARDVRESGIPLETFKVKNKTGRTIAAYKFGDFKKASDNRLGGRSLFSKNFKATLYTNSGEKCYICQSKFEERYLQIDHRTPYEVGGDDKTVFQKKESDYMLLCGSCNRAKSWSCEHCPNWKNEKEEHVCKECYWGSPEKYTHVATSPVRRLDIQWASDETEQYDEVKKRSIAKKTTMPEYVKVILEQALKGSPLS
jgi:hypothetical protein